MYREVIVAALSFLFSQASLAQHIDNVEPGSSYEKIGLRAGDTIISYDNQNVDSPSAAKDLYSKLNSGKIETVTIKRNVSNRKNPITEEETP